MDTQNLLYALCFGTEKFYAFSTHLAQGRKSLRKLYALGKCLP